ncbi:GNAT family N-acetyltransferase [Nocardia cyriacigeorgica]|uniref:GNAT family N-acetyltransferase n=2 Tax=Nocardia cyriacigeorgica TaxID=135487 RepID=UPI000688627F|nr:GNAT family N-acetyltransferase [Nocardia cyriacigeorgica]AVH23567.1 N-acetyltransferase [Nocardia cyriacigeorgica]PPJ15596.1 N-acetyltransferase [Nocardia cyriacigeorgica]TLF55767.1 GNAT family N-acetyltransferase [Nocardia cyriacigeorgica]
MSTVTRDRHTAGTTYRPLMEHDLPEADSIFRLAFGTFIGLPDPMAFAESADLVGTRWAADPSAAFAADIDGRLAGTNFGTRWGSVGVVGPLTVRPEYWDRGLGSLLMEPVMERFAAWDTTLQGLFTFAQSPKHVELYRKFGFWPRYLTAIMRKPVRRAQPASGWMAYSELSGAEEPTVLSMCRTLTDSVYEGLDLSGEMARTRTHGDTVLIMDGRAVTGMAVCHLGAGTEAGDGVCLVKFGAVSPGRGAGERFEQLLDACEDLAAERGAGVMEAGTSLARTHAYGSMVARGYRTYLQGIAMHRPGDRGYSHPEAYVIDDWR